MIKIFYEKGGFCLLVSFLFYEYFDGRGESLERVELFYFIEGGFEFLEGFGGKG